MDDYPPELGPNTDPRGLRSWYNWLLRVALSQRIQGHAGIVEHVDPSGTALAYAPNGPVKMKLSGAASPYSGVLVTDAPGGTFEVLPDPHGFTGTSNVYEVNGVANLDGMIVDEVWHSGAADEWKFQWVGKGTKSQETTPGCPCPQTPVTINCTMVATGIGGMSPDFPAINPGTIIFQAQPAGYGGPNPGWYSAEATDENGDHYRYVMTCFIFSVDNPAYRVARIYKDVDRNHNPAPSRNSQFFVYVGPFYPYPGGGGSCTPWLFKASPNEFDSRTLSLYPSMQATLSG